MLLVQTFLTLMMCIIVVVEAQFTVTTSLPGTTLSEDDTGPYTMLCDITSTITNLTSINTTYSYFWVKDGAIVAVNDQVLADFAGRYSVELVDLVNATYHLSITNIAIVDKGSYTCLVTEGTLDNTTSIETITSQMVASSSETIAVRYFPSADPLCSADVESPIESGQVLTLSCTSDVGNPQVLLQWDSDDVRNSSISEESMTDVTGDTITLEQSVSLTDMATFTCRVSSPETYPGETSTCSLGPFTVTPSLGYVSISPANWWFQEEGGNAQFRCRLTSLGTVRWFTIPPTNDQGRFEVIGTDVYQLKGITMEDVGKRVVCEGTMQSGGVYWKYAELIFGTTTQAPTTTQPPSITTVAVATTMAATNATVAAEPSPLPTTSGSNGTTPVLNVTTTVSVVVPPPEGLDILLIAVVSAAAAFVFLVVLVVACACCCCCRRQETNNEKKGLAAPHEEFDWEAGLTPSNARTAPIIQPQPQSLIQPQQSPIGVPEQGPDPVIVRNPTHGISEYVDTTQGQTLIDDPRQGHPDEPEMSPYLRFAMTNLQVDDDENMTDDRMRIPRAVAREPPQVRRKSKKAKDLMVPSGSFVSRGHPLKRTPLGHDTFPEESASESLYSSTERPGGGSSGMSSYQTTPYASVERSSGSPPDVTVTHDPSAQMPDVTVGLSDSSPIVGLYDEYSPSPSPDNTAIPRKKLPAGARAAIGPSNASNAFLSQPQSAQTARLSAEIQQQDIVPTLGPSPDQSPIQRNRTPSPSSAPNVEPPTYEAVSRLKAMGLINSGFQPGSTDTMIIHDVKSHNSPDTGKQTNTGDIKYF